MIVNTLDFDFLILVELVLLSDYHQHHFNFTVRNNYKNSKFVRFPNTGGIVPES